MAEFFSILRGAFCFRFVGFFFSLGFLGPIVELFFCFVLQRRKISFLFFGFFFFFFFFKAMMVALLDLSVCFGS